MKRTTNREARCIGESTPALSGTGATAETPVERRLKWQRRGLATFVATALLLAVAVRLQGTPPTTPQRPLHAAEIRATRGRSRTPLPTVFVLPTRIPCRELSDEPRHNRPSLRELCRDAEDWLAATAEEPWIPDDTPESEGRWGQ